MEFSRGTSQETAGHCGRVSGLKTGDPGRNVEECPEARAWKCPTEGFLSAFGHLARSAPKSVSWVFSGTFALKQHSLGHSEPDAQKHSKSTPWGTFRPGPLGTPVSGGRDRNSRLKSVSVLSRENSPLLMHASSGHSGPCHTPKPLQL